jgi:phosphoribosylformylglycinamidine synthase
MSGTSPYLARVYVSLKPTVNDPEGNTIAGALHSLGFGGVERVRSGKFIQVRVNAATEADAEQQVQQMCQKLLANPVIETFSFDLAPIPAQ